MDRGAGLPVVLGNILFTIIAIVALRLGGWSGVATVGLAGAYFTLSTMAIILTATGGLRDVLLACIQHAARIAEIILLILWQRRASGGTHGAAVQELEIMPEIPRDYRTWVPAVPPSHDQAVKQQARAWLVSLFDERTGELDSHKVYAESSSANSGWLRERAPIGDVRGYLLSRGAIRQVPNGYALNMNKVGTLRDVEGIIR